MNGNGKGYIGAGCMVLAGIGGWIVIAIVLTSFFSPVAARNMLIVAAGGVALLVAGYALREKEDNDGQ